MEHTVEKLTSNKVKIMFKVPAASFEEAIEKAYVKTRGRINVPGFRKGKAPRKLIERMYGDMIFFDDALDMLFPEAFMAAVKENDLQPVGRPELDVQEMEKGRDLAFSCEVFVRPDVKLGQYKEVGVTRVIREVSKEEVDARVAQEQKRVARSVEVTDRPVENGDQVNLDYSGTVDGKLFVGGTAKGQSLLIGSNSFIPGFEEQMVGMKIDEERDLELKFPEKYHSEELQGKDVIFHVKVNGITREELPELDDEFASEVSEFDTFQEYWEDLRKKMQEAADAQSTEAAKQSMVETVVRETEIDLPDPMVEDKLDEMMEQMSWRMQQQGFTMKKYLEMTGQGETQMRDMYREEAKNSLKTDLTLEQIIKEENILPDEKDVEGMLAEYASAIGQSLEQLKDSLSDGQKAYFTRRSQVNAALDLMWDSAKVTDQKAEDVPKDPENGAAGKVSPKKASKKMDDAADVKEKDLAPAHSKEVGADEKQKKTEAAVNRTASQRKASATTEAAQA